MNCSNLSIACLLYTSREAAQDDKVIEIPMDDCRKGNILHHVQLVAEGFR